MIKKHKIIFGLLPAAIGVVVGLSLMPPSPTKRHLQLAQKLEQSGMPAQAEDEYILATRSDPAHGQAWLGLARVVSQTGRFRPAEGAYRKALDLLDEGREEALLGLGWILREESRMADLEKLGERARSLGEPNVAREFNVWRLIADIEERILTAQSVLSYDSSTRLTADGLAGLRARVDGLPDDTPGRDEAADLLSEAEQLAREALKEAALIENPRGRLLQARLHRMMGDAATAKSIAEDLAQAGDGRVSATASLMLARMAKEDGRADDALERVSQALSTDPANIAARLELKSVRVAMRSFESAMLDIDLAPDNAPSAAALADYNRGLFDLLRKDYTGAVIMLGEVVREHPRWIQARMALATAYYRSARKAEALVEFTRIAKQEPEFISPHLTLARLQVDRGQMDEAIVHARRVLAVEPTNPQALETLAEALIGSDRLAEGVDVFGERINSGKIHDPSLQRILGIFQEAAEKDETLFNVNALAMIHFARGDMENARRQFDRMRAISQTAPLTDYQLARLHQHNGEHAEAARVLKRAIKMQQRILEDKYADSLGIEDEKNRGRITKRKRELLTPKQRDLALRSTPLMRDLYAELGAIALKTNDYHDALDHSHKALRHNETHLKAAMQVIEARTAIADKLQVEADQALDSFGATLDKLGDKHLKTQHEKLTDEREKLREKRRRLRKNLKELSEKPNKLATAAKALDGAGKLLLWHDEFVLKQEEMIEQCEKILQEQKWSAEQGRELRRKLQQADEDRTKLDEVRTWVNRRRRELRRTEKNLRGKQKPTPEEREELVAIDEDFNTLSDWEELADAREEIIEEQKRLAGIRDELAIYTAAMNALTEGTIEKKRVRFLRRKMATQALAELMILTEALTAEFRPVVEAFARHKQDTLRDEFKKLTDAFVKDGNKALKDGLGRFRRACEKAEDRPSRDVIAKLRNMDNKLGGMTVEWLAVFVLRTILVRTLKADAEFAAGADVLWPILVADKANAPLLDKAADLYEKRADATKLAPSAYKSLAAKATAMHNELKADHTALARRQDLSDEDRRDAEGLEKQMATLLNVLLTLQAELAKAGNHISRYTDLAKEYRQRARELRGKDEAGAAGADQAVHASRKAMGHARKRPRDR